MKKCFWCFLRNSSMHLTRLATAIQSCMKALHELSFELNVCAQMHLLNSCVVLEHPVNLIILITITPTAIIIIIHKKGLSAILMQLMAIFCTYLISISWENINLWFILTLAEIVTNLITLSFENIKWKKTNALFLPLLENAFLFGSISYFFKVSFFCSLK